ncbi:MAG: vWA domain-containing protein [Anaerolineae bacterium]
MARLMRCLYCGLLQDEPAGVKQCSRCGGELTFEQTSPALSGGSYLDVQLELDQVHAPPGRNVDRYLLVTLRAPQEVPPEHAVPRETKRPPLHFVPVLDVSGSMAASGKIAYAKEALRQALYYLQDGDTFSLVTFESEVKTIIQPTTFDARTRQQVESLLSELDTGNMTALDGGLEQGIQLAHQASQPTTLVLLLSDGQANVGETDLEKVAGRATRARQKGIIVSTLGVGLDYNEALMVEIANQGGGRFYHIQQPDQIPAALMQELGSTAMLAARQVELEFDLPTGAALVSLTSLYPTEQVNQVVRVRVGDLLPGLRLEIPLRLTLYAHRPGERVSVSGRIRYQSPIGHTLGGTLNTVTVRFVEAQQFEEMPGLVVPVMERVLEFRRAAQVLDFARLREQDLALAQREAEQQRRALLEYARQFNPARAMELEAETVDALFADAPAAKATLHRAARAIRGLV